MRAPNLASVKCGKTEALTYVYPEILKLRGRWYYSLVMKWT